MRQPGRHLFADLTDRTFSDNLEELLSENMFMSQREVAGIPLVVPRWEHRFEYEYQLRKEAIRLTVEEKLLYSSSSLAHLRGSATGYNF